MRVRVRLPAQHRPLVLIIPEGLTFTELKARATDDENEGRVYLEYTYPESNMKLTVEKMKQMGAAQLTAFERNSITAEATRQYDVYNLSEKLDKFDLAEYPLSTKKTSFEVSADQEVARQVSWAPIHSNTSTTTEGVKGACDGNTHAAQLRRGGGSARTAAAPLGAGRPGSVAFGGHLFGPGFTLNFLYKYLCTEK